MLYPIIAFAIGLALLVLVFGVGWAGWFAGETAVPVGYFWLFLGAFVICTTSIIRWGAASKSYRDRKRWVAFILGSVLVMGFGVWWIVSLGGLIFPAGLVLLVVSTQRLVGTFGSREADVVDSKPYHKAMQYPLIVFTMGAILQVTAFGVGWVGWFSRSGTLLVFWWLFLITMMVCLISIILWGHRSKSCRNRQRWGAYVLAALLIVGFAYRWILSLGILIFPIGLALLIFSLVRLGLTLRSSDDVALSNRQI